jgi:hypothetical protein
MWMRMMCDWGEGEGEGGRTRRGFEGGMEVVVGGARGGGIGMIGKWRWSKKGRGGEQRDRGRGERGERIRRGGKTHMSDIRWCTRNAVTVQQSRYGLPRSCPLSCMCSSPPKRPPVLLLDAPMASTKGRLHSSNGTKFGVFVNA